MPGAPRNRARQGPEFSSSSTGAGCCGPSAARCGGLAYRFRDLSRKGMGPLASTRAPHPLLGAAEAAPWIARRLLAAGRSAMKIQTAIVTIALLYAALLLAREKTDVIVMNNGDRMTCEVKGLDAGVLYVSFDYIDGTASVDWSKVARLESNQLFVVKTETGKVYTGTLTTTETATDRPVKIQVLGLEKRDAIDSSEIVQMVATSDRFWQRFNGDVSFGVIYSKGNQSTQYSLGSQTAYVRERWTALAGFSSQLSSSSG